MDDLILCGIMKIDDDWTEIYQNPEFGELIFEWPTSGVFYYISDVEMPAVVALNTTEKLKASIDKDVRVIGMVIGPEQVLAILSESTAEFRPLASVWEPTGNTIMIDMDMEADIDEE